MFDKAENIVYCSLADKYRCLHFARGGFQITG